MPKTPPSRLSLQLFGQKIIDDNILIARSNIPNAGRGAFARRDIPIWTMLGDYIGEPCTPQSSDGDYILDVSVWRTYDGVARNVKLCIDAQNLSKSNWTRYINSVTKNNKSARNVQFYVYGERNREKVGIRAIKNIEEGDELLLDYGDEFF